MLRDGSGDHRRLEEHGGLEKMHAIAFVDACHRPSDLPCQKKKLAILCMQCTDSNSSSACTVTVYGACGSKIRSS